MSSLSLSLSGANNEETIMGQGHAGWKGFLSCVFWRWVITFLFPEHFLHYTWILFCVHSDCFAFDLSARRLVDTDAGFDSMPYLVWLDAGYDRYL
jgi:copper oxidase (laccase) domain-containing protein